MTRLIAAMSISYHNEAMLCRDIVRQRKDEEFVSLINVARRERRLNDVKAYKEQRFQEKYTPSTVSSEDMASRLRTLLNNLESRYDELADKEDDDACLIVSERLDELKVIMSEYDNLSFLPPLDLSLISMTSSPMESTKTDTSASIHSASFSRGTSAKISSPSTPMSPLSMSVSTKSFDSVQLLNSLSNGMNSSGKSIILDALFTGAHTTTAYPVKVKIFRAAYTIKAHREYDMMSRLHRSDHGHFIRPYGFLNGVHGQIIPHTSDDREACALSVCIAMEAGVVDMHTYFMDIQHVAVSEKIAIISQLLDILVAAHLCRVVLVDFKLNNVVRVSDGKYYYRLKAIDFDNSRLNDEEMPYETTAAYSCPEVARAILALTLGTEKTRLRATDKMDIMALGWTVYEVANNMKSYWRNQAIPILDDNSILIELSHLKDEDVKKNIEATFIGGQYTSLRSWLIHALKADPSERATADQLLNHHSLFGSKERTADYTNMMHKLSSNVDLWGEKIMTRFDELSDSLTGSLGKFGDSLEVASLNMALGSEQNKRGIENLYVLLESQMKMITEGGVLDCAFLESAVKNATKGMEANLSAQMSSSINELMTSVSVTDPSQTEKLDTLLSLMGELGGKSDRLQEDIKEFRLMTQAQGEMLAAMEYSGNCMPHSFVILPEVTYEKLAVTASVVDKMKNVAKRKTLKMKSLLWSKSRIVFICPITLKQVRCILLFRIALYCVTFHPTLSYSLKTIMVIYIIFIIIVIIICITIIIMTTIIITNLTLKPCNNRSNVALEGTVTTSRFLLNWSKAWCQY